jgi:hypothetical protein
LKSNRASISSPTRFSRARRPRQRCCLAAVLPAALHLSVSTQGPAAPSRHGGTCPGHVSHVREIGGGAGIWRHGLVVSRAPAPRRSKCAVSLTSGGTRNLVLPWLTGACALPGAPVSGHKVEGGGRDGPRQQPLPGAPARVARSRQAVLVGGAPTAAQNTPPQGPSTGGWEWY